LAGRLGVTVLCSGVAAGRCRSGETGSVGMAMGGLVISGPATGEPGMEAIGVGVGVEGALAVVGEEVMLSDGAGGTADWRARRIFASSITSVVSSSRFGADPIADALSLAGRTWLSGMGGNVYL
jgi:hypothetical protein